MQRVWIYSCCSEAHAKYLLLLNLKNSTSLIDVGSIKGGENSTRWFFFVYVSTVMVICETPSLVFQICLYLEVEPMLMILLLLSHGWRTNTLCQILLLTLCSSKNLWQFLLCKSLPPLADFMNAASYSVFLLWVNCPYTESYFKVCMRWLLLSQPWIPVALVLLSQHSSRREKPVTKARESQNHKISRVRKESQLSLSPTPSLTQ